MAKKLGLAPLWQEEFKVLADNKFENDETITSNNIISAINILHSKNNYHIQSNSIIQLQKPHCYRITINILT